MADNFEKLPPGLDSPASRAFEITPNDSADLSVSARALYIGTAGNVKVDTVGGDTAVTFVGVSGILPVRVSRVYATDTDADDIVGLY